MAMTTEKIGSSVRCIWGATFGDIAVLEYAGDGKFVGEGDIRFLDLVQNRKPVLLIG